MRLERDMEGAVKVLTACTDPPKTCRHTSRTSPLEEEILGFKVCWLFYVEIGKQIVGAVQVSVGKG